MLPYKTKANIGGVKKLKLCQLKLSKLRESYKIFRFILKKVKNLDILPIVLKISKK